jgi:hypothetical protein
MVKPGQQVTDPDAYQMEDGNGGLSSKFKINNANMNH